jgi:hypothetical protein
LSLIRATVLPSDGRVSWGYRQWYGHRRLRSVILSAVTFEIAQLNVSRAVAPLDSPALADFVARLDEINALAERSPGFRWRLQGEGGNATGLRVGDDPLVIVNLTVWATIDDLFAFTYRSSHKTVFARRFEWFERSPGPSTVLVRP